MTVAFHSGHNLKIAKRQYGCRLPFEIVDANAGEGYAGAGPVTTRQMTEEERKRYGPPSGGAKKPFVFNRSMARKPKEDKNVEEVTEYRISKLLTIAQAVKVRDEIKRDLADLILLVSINKDVLSCRTLQLLQWYCDQYQLSLDRIEVAFANTEVLL